MYTPQSASKTVRAWPHLTTRNGRCCGCGANGFDSDAAAPRKKVVQLDLDNGNGCVISADGLVRFAKSKSSGRTPLRHSNRFSRLLLVVFAAVAFATSGCSAFRGVSEYIQYNDDTNDFVTGFQNAIGSHLAWHARAGDFSDMPDLSTFGAGFRAGYRDVASGGNGCPPPVPPRKYWGWKYQTEEGQAKVSAWYAGFPFGAMDAEQKGVGKFRDIQASYLIKTQYSPEFRAGGNPEAQRELLPHTPRAVRVDAERLEGRQDAVEPQIGEMPGSPALQDHPPPRKLGEKSWRWTLIKPN
ncbi:MAG: hypothetical protein IID46_16185 [Planctomycetes bacterium]|nr:hypothetical protein [Planctomycetota bacterium]